MSLVVSDEEIQKRAKKLHLAVRNYLAATRAELKTQDAAQRAKYGRARTRFATEMAKLTGDSVLR